MNNQINQVVDQVVDQIEYYTKEETLYLCLLSELTSQRDHLRNEKERAKEGIYVKGESPSYPDQFRNHFEDQVFGYYRDEDGDFEDAEGDLFSPIEGVIDLEEHNPDIANNLLLEFLSQQICDYAWIVEYNQELFDKKDFSSLNRIFGWRAMESDIPLLPKNKDVNDFYYEIRESDKGNWIRDDIDEFMTEIEYDFSEDQLIAFDSVWFGKVGDEFIENEIDLNELNYQRKDLIENNLE